MQGGGCGLLPFFVQKPVAANAAIRRTDAAWAWGNSRSRQTAAVADGAVRADLLALPPWSPWPRWRVSRCALAMSLCCSSGPSASPGQRAPTALACTLVVPGRPGVCFCARFGGLFDVEAAFLQRSAHGAAQNMPRVTLARLLPLPFHLRYNLPVCSPAQAASSVLGIRGGVVLLRVTNPISFITTLDLGNAFKWRITVVSG